MISPTRSRRGFRAISACRKRQSNHQSSARGNSEIRWSTWKDSDIDGKQHLDFAQQCCHFIFLECPYRDKRRSWLISLNQPAKMIIDSLVDRCVELSSETRICCTFRENSLFLCELKFKNIRFFHITYANFATLFATFCQSICFDYKCKTFGAYAR